MSILAQSDSPRDRAPRRRAVLAIGAAALLLGIAATGTVPEPPPPQRHVVVEALALVVPDPTARPVQR
jgi:hypothetical protein